MAPYGWGRYDDGVLCRWLCRLWRDGGGKRHDDRDAGHRVGRCACASVGQGLAPGSTVTVTSRATDDSGVKWTGQAKFKVPSSGAVSLAQPSMGGSYKGANPMGLFELMAPPASSKEVVFESFFNLRPFTVQLSVSDNGKVLATGSARRTMTSSGVSTKRLRPDTDGSTGSCYCRRRRRHRGRRCCCSAAPKGVSEAPRRMRRFLPATDTRHWRWPTSRSPACRTSCTIFPWSTSSRRSRSCAPGPGWTSTTSR